MCKFSYFFFRVYGGRWKRIAFWYEDVICFNVLFPYSTASSYCFISNSKHTAYYDDFFITSKV